MSAPPPRPAGRLIGRYALYDCIATGGMAAVHLGRLLGPVGFARTVAIKRLHDQFAKDPEFVSMFLDEARLAARIRHPNVVSVLDVVATGGELFLVMDYIQGESLSRLLRVLRDAGEPVPPRIASGVLMGVLLGLHAAHEARGDRGLALDLVHRDVSPQNVLVGTDGVARVVDFGIAKAAGRLQATRDGQLKGKARYMAPEQVLGNAVDRRADVYAAAVVLWETLVGRRPFEGDGDVSVLYKVLEGEFDPPGKHVAGLPAAVDDLVARGLCRDPAGRFPTAVDMADALEKALPPAGAREIGAWVEHVAGDLLAGRADLLAEVESVSSVDLVDLRTSHPPPGTGPTRSEVPTRIEEGTGAAKTADRRAAPPRADEVTKTSSSVTSAPPRRRTSARRMGIAAAAAVAVLGGGALAVRAVSTPAGARDGRSSATAPSAVSPPSAATSVATSQVEAPASATATAGATAASPTSSAAAATSATATAIRTATPIPTRTPTPTATATATAAATAKPASTPESEYGF